MIEKKRIESLEGVRGIAFLLVFISHIGKPELEGLGQFAVSVFLIMSGFLLMYNHWNSIKEQNGVAFSIRKLRYLYPLHIICMLAMIAMRWIFNPYKKNEIGILIRKVYLNFLMIQEWYSFDNHLSINPVSWYMCVLLLIYALFPYLLRKVKQNWNVKKAFVLIFFAFLAQVLICIIADKLLSISDKYNLGIKRKILWWLCYYYPPTRFLDFFIGCNLGYIFLHNKLLKINEKKYTFIEILTVIFSLICCFCGQKLYLTNQNYCFTYTLIYTISASLIVYYFALEKGLLSKNITNCITRYFARISPFGFLIHFVVFEYIWCFAYKFKHNTSYVQNNKWWMNLTIGLVVTILLSEMYIFVIKQIRRKQYDKSEKTE